MKILITALIIAVISGFVGACSIGLDITQRICLTILSLSVLVGAGAGLHMIWML